MNCDRATERFLARLAGEHDPAEDALVDRHLQACAACRDTTVQLAAFWKVLGSWPQATPSPALRPRFDAMLEAYRQGALHAGETRAPRVPGWGARIGAWLDAHVTRRPALQLAGSLALLLVGFGAGSWLGGGGRHRGEIDMLRQEVQSTRTLVALSLLQQRSPADRLQGITWSARVDSPDPEVVGALLATIDSDPNVNVRLAAIDALVSARNVPPMVGSGLVATLDRQTSPLVQIAVIDALVQLDGAQAADPLRALLADAHTDKAVRQRAEWALKQLTF